jgi:TRAP-type C4-dicarboxylate transport system permease small subunit
MHRFGRVSLLPARERRPTGTVQTLKAFAYLLERFALFILLIGGLGLLMSMFLGVGDVIGTQVLETPLPGARELTESTMVLIVFGALAYAQIQRSHIRVELLYSRMGPRTKAVMDVLADAAALLFFSLLLWQAVNEAILSWELNEATVGLIRFPLYPARIILVAGTGLLILRLLIDLIEDLDRVRTGARLGTAPGEPAGAPLEGLGIDPDGSARTDGKRQG